MANMEHTPQTETPFTVLIAGGSIAGLSLALLLSRAGINYILLERGNTFTPQVGASIGWHPPAIGILDQLGLWENDIKPIAVPLHTGKHFTREGVLFGTAKNHLAVHERLGYPIVFIERKLYLETAFKHIPEEEKKTRLHLNAAVESMAQDENGVTVTTIDGRTFRGDILIGADGVHSRIRDLISPELKKGLVAEYNCIFGMSNVTENTPMEAGMVYNTYDEGVSNVCASGVEGKIYWFFFKKSGITHPPDVPRFSNEDMEKLAEQYGSMPMCHEWKLADAWKAREKAVLVPLEEGVIKKWNERRVLLVGDAAHKFTINAGFGGNTALESCVHLSNRLHKLLAGNPNAHPSTAELVALFQDFEAVQRPRAESVLNLSAKVTRLEAQDGMIMKLVSLYVLPRVSDGMKAGIFSGIASTYPDVEYLPLKPMQRKKKSAKSGMPFAGLLTAAAAVGMAGLFLQSQYGMEALKVVGSLIAAK